MALATNELELVSALRRHEEVAFGMLVDEYGPQIRRWIRRQTDDPVEADDIEQDVLLAVWTGAPRLRPDTILLPWLFTITANACRKRTRTRLRKSAVPAGLVPRDEPAVHLEEVAESVAVQMALRQLPEREAGILRLLYGEDVSLPEAARQLNVSSEAAKSLAARARRRFKDRFHHWFKAMAGVALPLQRLAESIPTRGGMTAAVAAAALTVTLAGAGGPAPEAARGGAALTAALAPIAADPHPRPATVDRPWLLRAPQELALAGPAASSLDPAPVGETKHNGSGTSAQPPKSANAQAGPSKSGHSQGGSPQATSLRQGPSGPRHAVRPVRAAHRRHASTGSVSASSMSRGHSVTAASAHSSSRASGGSKRH